MKYLKSYKIFESQKEDIIPELRDICLELEDIGFRFHLNKSSDKDIIEFVIYKKDSTKFAFSDEFSEVVDRIYQFMRESGWYSHLSYNLGGGIRKKFYIRPDGRMRDQEFSWIDNNWPYVLGVDFYWYKNYDDKVLNEAFDTVPQNLVNIYGNVIVDMNDCFEFIEDKLSELDDIGYETIVGFTPMTMAKARKSPELYINIGNKERGDFYQNELVEANTQDIIEYMKSKGFEVNNLSDNRIDIPTEFEFSYRKTYYQISFIKSV